MYPKIYTMTIMKLQDKTHSQLKPYSADLVNPHSKTVIFLDIAIQVLLQLQLKSVFRSGFVSLSQSICDIVAPVSSSSLFDGNASRLNGVC